VVHGCEAQNGHDPSVAKRRTKIRNQAKQSAAEAEQYVAEEVPGEIENVGNTALTIETATAPRAMSTVGEPDRAGTQLGPARAAKRLQGAELLSSAP
jgi:hypothetical protein